MSRAGRNPRAQSTQAALILAELESVRARLAALERGSAHWERPQLTGDNTPSSDTLSGWGSSACCSRSSPASRC